MVGTSAFGGYFGIGMKSGFPMPDCRWLWSCLVRWCDSGARYGNYGCQQDGCADTWAGWGECNLLWDLHRRVYRLIGLERFCPQFRQGV